jgi:hypothetical protein
VFKGWFQKKPQVAAEGCYRHGNEHLIEIRNISDQGAGKLRDRQAQLGLCAGNW